MKDKLKIYADKHREDFDQYSLNLDDAWQVIEKELSRHEKKTIHLPWRSIVKMTAVILVLMMVGIGYYVNGLRSNMDENGIALRNISVELADTEAFYTSKIEEKLALINASAEIVEPEVHAQLEILDDEYTSLRNDLKDNANSEEVINAMIENYRLKLRLLEKILEEIQKNNEHIDYEEVLAI